MGDGHRIGTLEQIRELVGEPIPGVAVKVAQTLEPPIAEFIAKAPFVVLSTADATGRQDASPKGDGPGFVLIEDEQTLVIPDRPGNRLIFGLQNILENPQVGLLFLVPGTNETVRVNGRAELTRDPALLERLAARGKPALLAIRVHVDQCFFHCAKAFIRSQLWKPDSWPARIRVSFGEMMARKLGAGEDAARDIDKFVEDDYRTNL
jgi:PPOX class probable FMN-dependent enzyme